MINDDWRNKMIFGNMINKIKDIYHYGDNKFYLSLFGPLAMGTIHIVAIIIKFDWIIFNYCIFYYLMAIFKVWQWAIGKYNIKPNHYIAGIISVFIILAPMMASFIMTILYREAPHYFFDWFIYAYALYGTIKMIFAIKNMVKKEKSEKEDTLAFINMISALYTIQMLEFALVTTFSDEKTDSAMYLMQLFTQGFIFLFSIFIIVILSIKTIKKYKSNNI